ncbi:DUF72 domain-containing protein [Acetomicrobium sp.]|uniref:DUF72 domain-containing protein n=1 Tax=Acetomicrobium sp. TaxID=1872099 RepID=UPI0028715190|nr:DUF72 domain-containing protein [Acetomicrobium sp.]MDR9770261.1 DUF72 domain-containing protein [Acetomicrobium sp.]
MKLDVDFRIGTCSWADRSLLSSEWYPKNCQKGRERLRYYSSFFDTVEADSFFYALPDPSAIYSWIAATPPEFLFNVKAHALFTNHFVSTRNLPPWCRAKLDEKTMRVTLKDLDKKTRRQLLEEYRSLLSILKSTNRLGYVLFQFSPYTRFDERWLVYMKRIREMLPSYHIAIEVRHVSWFSEKAKDRFLGLLTEENMAYVAVDEPALSWTIPNDWYVTASWGSIVRFHGRNAAGWSKGATVQEKYKYKYTLKELEAWRDLALNMTLPKRVFIMFNNCYKDYAVQNALSMKRLFGLTKDDALPLQISLLGALKEAEDDEIKGRELR